MSQKITITKEWLEKLLYLKKEADKMIVCEKEDHHKADIIEYSRLNHLFGFIESAEYLLKD